MKKILSVSLAVMAAFVFSAFTPERKATLPMLFYEVSSGNFQEIPDYDDACPTAHTTQCVIEIDGQNKALWEDQGSTPYLARQ